MRNNNKGCSLFSSKCCCNFFLTSTSSQGIFMWACLMLRAVALSMTLSKLRPTLIHDCLALDSAINNNKPDEPRMSFSHFFASPLGVANVLRINLPNHVGINGKPMEAEFNPSRLVSAAFLLKRIQLINSLTNDLFRNCRIFPSFTNSMIGSISFCSVNKIKETLSCLLACLSFSKSSVRNRASIVITSGCLSIWDCIKEVIVICESYFVLNVTSILSDFSSCSADWISTLAYIHMVSAAITKFSRAQPRLMNNA